MNTIDLMLNRLKDFQIDHLEQENQHLKEQLSIERIKNRLFNHLHFDIGGIKHQNIEEPIIKFDEKIVHKENTSENQKRFEDNEKVFRGQCAVVMAALNRGERLSVVSAIQLYQIGDLRRRIKDLKDNYDVTNIRSEYVGRSKVWFLE